MSSTKQTSGNNGVELPIGSSGRTAKEVAVAAVGLAERVIVSGYSKVQRFKYKGRRDVVTDTDVASENAILNLIRAEFPDHGILAEESGTSEEQADFQWVIDPLDGTFNYSQAIPVFCTSIALAYRGEVILGVIKDPLRRELYLAVKGQGATLNGRPMRVSTKTDISNAAIGFDLGYNEALRKKALEQAAILLPMAGTLRLFGSAALSLALTAAGKYDVFYHHWLFPWDLAAGVLLVTEAGGCITDWEGNPVTLGTRDVLASNHVLHDKILEILR